MVMETPKERRARWRSIYILYFTMFQMSLGFSIALTGVWPYLDRLEGGSSKELLGIVVGAHPLFQLAVSPLLGMWADRTGSVRAPLVTTLILSAIASAMYSLLHLTRPNALYWMIAARALLGLSSGNIAVVRSYTSAATLLEERTRAVAGVSLAQVLGFVIGPAIQAVVAPLGPGPPYPGPVLRLDMYTAAGWLNALLSLLNLFLLLPVCFSDRRIAAREAMLNQGKSSEAEVMAENKVDPIGCWTLVGTFFILVFNFVLLETLATSLVMDQFAWNKKQALEYMGGLMSAGAVVACITFAVISPITKYVQERNLLIWGGFLPVCIASLLCIPWGPGPPPLAPPPSLDGDHEATGGCPQHVQPWCENSRGLQLSQFFIGYGLISIGYPVGVTLIQTLFSKILGPRPQGVWQGVLTGAGCLSRVLGPAFVSVVYARAGPDPTFLTMSVITLLALIVLRAVFSRLVPKPVVLPPTPVELQPLAPATNGNGVIAVETNNDIVKS